MSKLADLQLSTGALKPFTFKHAKRDGTVIDVTVMLRVLSKSEIDLARKNAHSTVKDLSAELKDGKSFEEMLAESRTIEMLAMACMDAEKPSEPWAGPMELAQKLHPGAIAALSRAYDEHQEECGPFVHDLTVEQYEALLEVIAQEASADPLALFAAPLRNAFTITMAKELRSLRTERSLRSSESNERSSEPETASSDVREAMGDVHAEMAILRDNCASLAIRLMHLEAERHRSTDQ